MTYNTDHKKEILNAARFLLWFTRLDLAEFLTGERKRVKFIEYYLPKLVEEGRLFVGRYRKNNVYTIRNKKSDSPSDIEHGLTCTEILLRILRSYDGYELVSERFFKSKNLGVVPEWAIIFPTGAMMMLECSMAGNFGRTKLMREKVRRYQINLDRIEKDFNKWGIILFVFDAPRYKVSSFVDQYSPKDDAFYFVDLYSFLDVDGKQLSAPIYICGEDGKQYPLD